MTILGIEYAILIFVAAVGVIQVAAANADLRGLLFVGSRRWAAALGALIALAGFSWFFILVDRNVRGLEGLEQTLIFAPSAVASIIATVLAASVIHRVTSVLAKNTDSAEMDGDDSLRQQESAAQGLESLRRKTYVDALLERDRVGIR